MCSPTCTCICECVSLDSVVVSVNVTLSDACTFQDFYHRLIKKLYLLGKTLNDKTIFVQVQISEDMICQSLRDQLLFFCIFASLNNQLLTSRQITFFIL